MDKVKAESYTLKDSNGRWLGQVVITNDGMFSSVTDWGNFSYAWRSYGDNFKEFLCEINTEYFATKMATGLAYIARSRRIDKSCEMFSEKILPALQEVLRKELSKKRLNERKCPHCGAYPLVMNAGRRVSSDEYVSVCSECQKEIRESIHETEKD